MEKINNNNISITDNFLAEEVGKKLFTKEDYAELSKLKKQINKG